MDTILTVQAGALKMPSPDAYVALGLRALQQCAFAFEPENAVTQRIQATSTANRPDRERVSQRIDRVRLCGGKATSYEVTDR